MANDAFNALAHPLRRHIVERLSGGVASVGEVTRDFGVSEPTQDEGWHGCLYELERVLAG